MKVSVYDLNERNGTRYPSPGVCIYCYAETENLTDEHVVPYALAANSIILEKSCCVACQRIIQPYEQEVLKKQLGTFRAQIGAPSRKRKKSDAITDVSFEFFEMNDDKEKVRDLGKRTIPIDDAPIVVGLWSSPPPRIVLAADYPLDLGKPWLYVEKAKMNEIIREVAQERGAMFVGTEIAPVKRDSFLRALAKTAHAYAATMLGPDGFEPFLLDIILRRSDELERYVGDIDQPSPFNEAPEHTLQITLGEPMEGPAAGCVAVRIQLYPMLKSPAHIIFVGKFTEAGRIRMAQQHAATFA